MYCPFLSYTIALDVIRIDNAQLPHTERLNFRKIAVNSNKKPFTM